MGLNARLPKFTSKSTCPKQPRQFLKRTREGFCPNKKKTHETQSLMLAQKWTVPLTMNVDFFLFPDLFQAPKTLPGISSRCSINIC